MTRFAILLFWVLAGSIVIQAGMVGLFLAALRRRHPRPANAACPKTAVVLCLRGSDPFLPACIEAALQQDYPAYDLRVVVDSRSDPAWQVVQETTARCGQRHVRIDTLEQRRDDCSLKCSSLVQVISELDDSYEVVALLDADTVPHPTWLRELVGGLSDPRVGAATGNRWYMPAKPTWAGLVRYLWNAAAIVQMGCYGIPWGGTLALRMSALRQSGLLERWGKAFCEDTMVYRALRQQGLRVAFVPSLMMINRETCDLPGFFAWVRRQLLAARLYHPGWPAVAFHGLATPLLLLLAFGTLIAASVAGNPPALAWTAAALGGYLGLLPLLLGLLERSVRRIARERGDSTAWLSLGAAARMLPAILLTQVVYAAAMLSMLGLRSVDWRGVRYRVRGPWHIQLVEYRPYQRDASPQATLHSL